MLNPNRCLFIATHLRRVWQLKECQNITHTGVQKDVHVGVRLFGRGDLIFGNRDINKMRITSELHPAMLAPGMLGSIPGPCWVPPAKAVSPAAYLEKLRQAAAGGGGGGGKSLEELDTPINRLRWMLRETMGADGEFERRRAELVLLNGGKPVSEEDTVRSFVHSVQPGGDVLRERRRPRRADDAASAPQHEDEVAGEVDGRRERD